MAKKFTEKDLFSLLKNKYSGERGDYLVMSQVPSATGFANEGWIDALVVSMWPSNGIKWMAIEFKSDRADFLREISNPKKNAWAKECCHEFWYVGTSDVIKEEELPQGCGWMKPHGESLSIVRHASFKPDPKLDAPLVCAFLRAAEQNFKSDISKAVSEDRHYKDSLSYRTAVDEFLTRKGIKYWLPGADDKISIKDQIVNVLLDASAETSQRKSAERAMHILHNFKREMFGLMEIYLMLSAFTLEQTDQFGKYVIEEWGGRSNTMTKIMLGELLSKDDKKRMVMLRNFMKKYLGETKKSLLDNEEDTQGKGGPGAEENSGNVNKEIL